MQAQDAVKVLQHAINHIVDQTDSAELSSSSLARFLKS